MHWRQYDKWDDKVRTGGQCNRHKEQDKSRNPNSQATSIAESTGYEALSRQTAEIIWSRG